MVQNIPLGGGFKYLLFSPLFGEDFQFDEYFSDRFVQPPTSPVFHIGVCFFWEKTPRHVPDDGTGSSRSRCHFPAGRYYVGPI